MLVLPIMSINPVGDTKGFASNGSKCTAVGGSGGYCAGLGGVLPRVLEGCLDASGHGR